MKYGSVEHVDDPREPRAKVNVFPHDKWQILKDIVTISVAFMMHFTAFQGVGNLQSSINAENGLGVTSLSAIYAALIISCIFIPTLMIRKLTAKWTLCVSMLCYVPYIAFQFYPRFYTLVPAGILLGLGAAPMWAAKATYLTQVGQVYAKISHQAVEAIIVRFFGFFFFAWQTAELWGNLISSLVLSSEKESKDNVTIDLDICGANFCTAHVNENLERPPDADIYKISGIYLACIIIAVAIIAIFLDPLSRYGENRRGSVAAKPTPIRTLMIATAKQLKKPNQIFLIPITVFIGMEQAVLAADFTQAFVSCALGIHLIGYVMVCFGVVDSICSIIFGSAMKVIGRIPIILLGFILHGSLLLMMLFWRPNPEQPMIFFAISGLWGVADAVWQTQINGMYGALFRRNKEAAFSNFRLWESIGFVVTYASSAAMCAKMKLIVLLLVLLAGGIGWVIVEVRHKHREEKLKAMHEESNGKMIVHHHPVPTEESNGHVVYSEDEEERDDEDDELDEDINVQEEPTPEGLRFNFSIISFTSITSNPKH
ncbi:UNC93-like protein [Phlebotomus argentipes]|uniref:UNC93-like protein n=1 Tax=Phlebotomus argentipes TaxID=94469 RepID=UPI002892F652|nr:UNC93-like protein [Phlebotomus argentipes]